MGLYYNIGDIMEKFYLDDVMEEMRLGDFLKKLQELPVYEIEAFYIDDDDDNEGTEVVLEGEE